jgi:hypothetical protein
MNSYGGTIERQVVTADGPTLRQTDGRIKVQVCVSGKVTCAGTCVVEQRYVVPGSTCEIVDGPRVVVKETFQCEPPERDL